VDRELDRLVDLLADHATVVVSGAKAAAEIGVPHSTLHEWIERLRELGVHIDGLPGRGLVLKTVPDILTAGVIRRAARGTQFAAQVHHYYRIGSTMTAAADLAREGAPHGAIVVAEQQTAGRGRLGRSWHSPRAAGIYMSLLLRPLMPAARAPVLTLAAGLAVADAVSDITSRPTDLRWPNDVLLDGRKCCGILPQMTAEAERIRHVILGIGLNVNQESFPPELAGEAVSLAQATGRRLARADVLAAVLRQLDRRYREFAAGETAALIADFERRSSCARARRVSVETEPRSFTGMSEGLDACGFLLVRRDDTGAVEPVLSGTIRSV
jgi:BirA family biotin operon repressor/biotin-[acetyl-CoA-carboxylase] ligase